MIHLQKQAYTEATIKTKYKVLRVMLRDNVNLDDPEAVKLHIYSHLRIEERANNEQGSFLIHMIGDLFLRHIIFS